MTCAEPSKMAAHIARFWTPGHGPSRGTNVSFRGIVPLEVVGSHQKPGFIGRTP